MSLPRRKLSKSASFLRSTHALLRAVKLRRGVRHCNISAPKRFFFDPAICDICSAVRTNMLSDKGQHGSNVDSKSILENHEALFKVLCFIQHEFEEVVIGFLC